MPVLMQVCIVVLTLAVVTLVVVSLQVLLRVNRLTKEIGSGVEAFRTSMEDARHTFSKVRTALHTVEDVVDDVKAVSARFQSVGNHAMDAASAVVNEVEHPVPAGARAGTGRASRDLCLGDAAVTPESSFNQQWRAQSRPT